MRRIRYYLGKIWIKILIMTIISLIAIFSFAFYKGIKSIISYCDAFFVVGAIMIGLGVLSFVTYYGVFDIFGYSTSYVINGMRKNSVQPYKDFHDYIECKNEKRKKNKYNFLPYVIFGGVYIFIAGILLINI